jgi:integrase
MNTAPAPQTERMSLGPLTRESFGTVKDRDGNVIKLGIRERVAELRARVALGHDPARDKEESRKRNAETFKAIADQFLQYKKSRLRPGSYRQTERHILKCARPIHKEPLATLDRRTVISSVINVIADQGKTVTANRVGTTLHDFFGWAVNEGYIEQNPLIGRNTYEETPRDRVLTDAELKLIWDAAGDDHYGSIVKLLLLTGQRADEIASLRWSEIGDDAITLPPERIKNKGGKTRQPHLVPLSDPALAILEKQSQRRNGDGTLRDLVFGIGERGFSGWTQAKNALDGRIAKAAGGCLPHWTLHDLRRTMATVMAESPYDPASKKPRDPNKRYGLGVLPHVVEAVLGHISGHKAGVAGVYNHASYGPQKRQALELWANHVMALVEGRESNITVLRRPA